MSEQEISDTMVEAYKYQKIGDTSSAIASWQKLITVSDCPKDIKSNALLNIGDLHFKEGSTDLAIESIQKLLRSTQIVQKPYIVLVILPRKKKILRRPLIT